MQQKKTTEKSVQLAQTHAERAWHLLCNNFNGI